VDGEQIDTGGRVDEMGDAFAQKYGTSHALKDEVADEALYALLADDDRMRERIREHSGFRVRVRGTKLPEEAGVWIEPSARVGGPGPSAPGCLVPDDSSRPRTVRAEESPPPDLTFGGCAYARARNTIGGTR
jgi:hypothetical protein